MTETQQHTPSAVAQSIAERWYSDKHMQDGMARIVDEELAAHGAIDLREGVFRCRHCGNNNPLPNSLFERMRELALAARSLSTRIDDTASDCPRSVRDLNEQLKRWMQPFKEVR